MQKILPWLNLTHSQPGLKTGELMI